MCIKKSFQCLIYIIMNKTKREKIFCLHMNIEKKGILPQAQEYIPAGAVKKKSGF